MPAYDFRCISCSHTFEVTRPAGEKTCPACPECGGETKRVFTPVGVHFKGSGFYNTDYRGKAPKTAPAAEPKTESAPSCPSAGSSDGCASCPVASGE